jgi:hypothetical protein
LIATAAVIVAVIVAVAAFLVLRPDPSQQTGAQQSPTGANATPGAATADAVPTAPAINGTYRIHSDIEYSNWDRVEPWRCDPGDCKGIKWNGTNFQSVVADICSPNPAPYTTVVVDGIVQEMSRSYTCNYVVKTGVQSETWTRIGD